MAKLADPGCQHEESRRTCFAMAATDNSVHNGAMCGLCAYEIVRALHAEAAVFACSLSGRLSDAVDDLLRALNTLDAHPERWG